MELAGEARRQGLEPRPADGADFNAAPPQTRKPYWAAIEACVEARRRNRKACLKLVVLDKSDDAYANTPRRDFRAVRLRTGNHRPAVKTRLLTWTE